MNPPEKIYGWRETQLSVARYYGGCKFRGESYTIDFNHPDQPLVRQDILQSEIKANKQLAKEKKQLAKEKKPQDTTGQLFGQES